MGTTAISECRELSRELAATLSPQHELFAVYVASGLSYRESARRAGFHEDNGFRLTKISAVRARIEELASEPSERIRAGIDAELLMLRNRAANEDLNAEGRANIELRLKLLLAHAKLRGWIVDKKQVAKLSASVRMDRADLDAITADLERLAPGAIGQLERLKRAPTQVDIARIAAGEDDQRDGTA